MMFTLTKEDQIKLEKLTQITNSKAYTTFLYDCDGTLVDSMGPHILSYKIVASKYGINLDGEIINELAGWPILKVVEEIKKRYNSSFDIQEFANAKDAYFINHLADKVTPITFVCQHLLDHVGKVNIAVVSGGDRLSVTKSLNAVGLLDKVTYLVCAGETAEGKPSPQPFLKASEHYNTLPSQSIVFEDGNAGVVSAKSAQMDWVRIDQI